MALRVLIAGGGLGGLTLAHGLRQAGLEVAVFERDQPHTLDLSTTYRIHIDPSGSRALHACVSAELWQQFCAHAAAAPRGMAFATERLRQLAFVPEPDPDADPLARSHPISRAGLRQVLMHGLEDVIFRGKPLVRYELGTTAQAPVTAYFGDGTSARGDVLVGADGSTSAVRKQLLPHARVANTGIAGIAGKLYLTDSVRERLPRPLLDQMTMVMPPRDFGMFVAPFRRRPDALASHELDLPDHVFWAVMGQATRLGLQAGAPHPSGVELQQVARRLIERWHPLLPWLVAESDPHTIIALPLHSAAPVSAWPSTRVTLLGDAIHTMTPLQGLGGNTALRDAALLTHHLVEADRGRSDLVASIHTYEQAMLHYGFDAVQRSLQISEAVASANVAGRLGFRIALQAAERWPWLHHRRFDRPAPELVTWQEQQDDHAEQQSAA